MGGTRIYLGEMEITKFFLGIQFVLYILWNNTVYFVGWIFSHFSGTYVEIIFKMSDHNSYQCNFSFSSDFSSLKKSQCWTMVPDLIFLISFLKKSFVKTVTQVRDVWIEVRERASKPHLMLPSKLTCHVAGYSGCTWKTTVPPTVWLSRFESWVSRVEALGIPHFPLLHLGSLIFSSPLVLSWCLAFSTYAVSSLKQSFFCGCS